MSTHVCRCPITPAILEPSTEPVKCGCCGEPLTLTCANACHPEHHAIPERSVTPAPRAEEKAPRQYPPKACAWCHNAFIPTGGRAQFCPKCKADGITLANLTPTATGTPTE